MKLEPGTKVKCIENIFINFLNKDGEYKIALVGNTYTVIQDYEVSPVFMLDINGRPVTLSKSSFITLEDYRASQIEKILERGIRTSEVI